MITEYAVRTNVAGLWRVFHSRNSNLCSTNPWFFFFFFFFFTEDIRFCLTLFLISIYTVWSVELNFITAEAEDARRFQDVICFRGLRQ